MTKEEAKEILTHNWTRVDNPNYSESELDEAFFMAIEALSAKPQTDLISRADAIDSVWKLDKEATEYVIDDTHEIHGYCTAICVCVGELSALPSADADMSEYADRLWKIAYERGKREASAEAVQGWIPCSERLPDVGEIVIASWSDLWSDAIVFARRYCEDDWEWAYEQGSDYWESARDYDRESNPEAWMPLPTPYKGGDSE